MHKLYGDSELVEVTLIAPMTINDVEYQAGDTVSAPADVVALWRAAGIVPDT